MSCVHLEVAGHRAPACSSSPIPAGLGQLANVAPTTANETDGLLGRLAAVRDPRRTRGRRHPIALVLALAARAVPAGARSLAAIAEWASDAPAEVLSRLGAPCREPDRGPTAPAEATVRRVLQRIDGDALDTAVGSGSPTATETTTPTATPISPAPRSRWTARPCGAPTGPTAHRFTCSRR
ncbi:transposase family protein [Streptomyces sp. NPDC006662]|uniref:transposase family protein n=1 Tax=Streptomyces sp. NPDC006662 TaxID=3156902 RepID=UPI0033CBB03B